VVESVHTHSAGPSLLGAPADARQRLGAGGPDSPRRGDGIRRGEASRQADADADVTLSGLA
jgi:hypothetical protein